MTNPLFITDCPLTFKELQVLDLAAQGKTAEEIAKELGYSALSVRHMFEKDGARSISQKLGLDNRIQAIVWYTQWKADQEKLDLVLEYYQRELGNIYDLRIFGGANRRALDKAQKMLVDVRDRSKSRLLSDAYKQKLAEVEAALLIEIYCNNCDLLPSSSIQEVMLPIYRKLQKIAKEHEISNLLGTAYLYWGDTFYIKGEYASSLRLVEKAEQYLETGYEQVCTLRLGVVSNANNGENKAIIQNFENKAVKILETRSIAHPEYQIQLYSSLARAYATLREGEQALNNIDKAKKLYEQFSGYGDRLPLQKIYILKAELITILTLDPKEKNLIQNLAQTGYYLSEFFGYERYQSYFKSILETI